MTRILVVAAHPDDEVLGCGGTIAKHSEEGVEVHILFMADGEGARQPEKMADAVQQRQQAAAKAALCLGAQPPRFLGLPDNRMDEIPLLEIVQRLERHIAEIEPFRIYTHHGGDLNIDHRLTHQAVLTACRPVPGCSVQDILTFETSSSTEWGSQCKPAFRPMAWMNVSSVHQRWLAALECYIEELRPAPHPRSSSALVARVQWRGSTIGVDMAEAFQVERMRLEKCFLNDRRLEKFKN